MVRDLTSRKRAEVDLLLRDRAIRAVPQGVLITDASLPDHPIIYTSPGFETTTGYPSEEVVGRNCRFLQGKDTDPEAVRQLRDAIRDARYCTTVLRNYRKDGTSFWNEVTISPVRDESDRLTHFIGILNDITRRMAMEEQLRQSVKMEAVGRLAGGVAHDFNNLLTVINGYSALLLKDLPADDPNRESAEEIHHAGLQSAHLTRQLLTFGRQQVSDPDTINLNAVIRKSQKLLSRMIGEDIDIELRLAPDLWNIKADEGQMEQVLMNLAVNSRDAMPTGGRILIETEKSTADNHVLLRVSDTGHGMTPEVRERVFEPFFTTKGLGRGTGLGLSTVYNIVRQSRGHASVQSEVGQGTTFIISLPRTEDDAEPAAIEDSDSPSGSETILLVEDEARVLAFSRKVLLNCGYKVFTATNGQDALKFAAEYESPLDLLVTDVVMPGMGGREVAERIQELRSEIRILFVSGYTDDAVVRYGVQFQEVDFLQKPFTPSDFAGKVREVLDRSAGEAQG